MTHPLAVLLHYANASVSFSDRDTFYALKDRLLAQYATASHLVWQHILDPCLGPYPHDGCLGARCIKCGGTGIYHERNIRLVVFRWAGYTFHKPIPSIRGYESLETHLGPIEGRIRHVSYGRRSQEARLWLYLLTGEWRALWRQLRGSASCGWYAWPMLTVQRVTMWAAMKLHRRACWCGRRFWTLGSGWQICGRCRVQRMLPAEDGVLDDSEPPF